MNISSRLLNDAVESFASLPGIGKKTALRLALHVFYQDENDVVDFVKKIHKMRIELKSCTLCGNIADLDKCNICLSPKRKKSIICIVESIRDIMAIEETAQFDGVYHVLGGVISPVDGIGPDDLNIDSLINRCQLGGVNEIIMAIPPTIEGETTIYYLSKFLKKENIDISVLARGISFGGDLEYTDEVTLGRSILSRLPYK